MRVIAAVFENCAGGFCREVSAGKLFLAAARCAGTLFVGREAQVLYARQGTRRNRG